MNRSNQQMLRIYKAERRQEERNDVVQQAELYEQLAKERGLDNQATVLARLAKNVFKKSFDVLPQATKSGLTEIKDLLVKSVEDKSLSNVLKSLLLIPKSELNARQKVIQIDFTNPEFKKMLNEVMADNLDKSPAELVDIMIEAIAGSEGKADFIAMMKKAWAIKSRSGSLDSVGSLGSVGSDYSDAPTASTMVTEAGMGKVREETIQSSTAKWIKNDIKERGWALPDFKGKEQGAKKNNPLLYRAEYRKLAKEHGVYEE